MPSFDQAVKSPVTRTSPAPTALAKNATGFSVDFGTAGVAIVDSLVPTGGVQRGPGGNPPLAAHEGEIEFRLLGRIEMEFQATDADEQAGAGVEHTPVVALLLRPLPELAAA